MLTTVYVTHDQEEAMALSTRLAVFDHGVIQLGAPAEIYRRPASPFVAEFLGAANLLPATAETARRVRLRGGPVLTVDATAPPGTAVLCLIRPETVRLASSAPVNHFAATVRSAVYLGGRHDCELALGEGLTVRADLPSSAAMPPPKPGDTIGIMIAPEVIVILLD